MSAEHNEATIDLEHFQKLKPFVDSIAKGRMAAHQMFCNCLKASLVKCYEFNLHVRRPSEHASAFFSIAALRGICEDLIVLNYIKSIPERDELIGLLVAHEYHSKMKSQHNFFSKLRPQQPIIPGDNVGPHIKMLEAKIHPIWQRNGWPKFDDKSMPPIADMAAKQKTLPVLQILYDYFYRLTSSSVHFSIQSMMRSGWGPDINDITFSTVHLNRYFEAYSCIYGAILFCTYFQFFHEILSPDAATDEVVAQIRKDVYMRSRWPEMVTPEEMNIDVPKVPDLGRIMLSSIQAEENAHFIS